MKVLGCSSLVLAVLVVMAAGTGEQGVDREAFWRSFFRNMTSEVCAGDNAPLCQANAARCYAGAESDKYKVTTEEAAAYAKARFIDCAERCSVEANFDDVTLETFSQFPLPGYWFDLIGLFLHYGVPEDKLSPMSECTAVEMLTDLRACLVSPIPEA